MAAAVRNGDDERGFVIAARLPGGAIGARIGLFRLDRDGNVVNGGFGTGGHAVVAGQRLDTDNRTYGLVSRLRPNGYPDSGWVSGILDDTSKTAPPPSGGESFLTGFADLLFAHGRMVAVGSSVDSATTDSDCDAVVTRFRADLVLANAFE